MSRLDHSGAIQLFESISDDKHPGWNAKVKNGDVGGPMQLIRERMVTKPGAAFTTLLNGTPTTGVVQDYWGTLFPCDPAMMQYPNSPASDEAFLNMTGASAIEQTAPGNSTFDAWESLGELYKDGLPRPIANTTEDRISVAKQAGSNYLNIEFGWKPLVDDVLKFADTINRAASVLQQLERDAGRVVRRKRVILEQRDESQFETLGYGPPSVGGISYNPAGFGTYELEIVTWRKIWFSAAFTYYIPGNVNSSNAIIKGAAKANALFGIELTPKKLWNLAPWTWMADWFSNIGDVISNVERFASGNLVMHYGYLMEHAITDHIYTWVPGGFGSSNGVMPGPVILRTESKQRVQANPFGFGINWDALSAWQLSILASLGITRKK